MITIPARHYSPAVWAWIHDQVCYNDWYTAYEEAIYAVKTKAPELEKIMAGYESAKLLGAIVNRLTPKRIVEIGTFSGFTAMVMALNCGAKIYTCDKDNDIFNPKDVLKKDAFVSIQVFPKTRAIDMLRTLEPPIDLFFLDGRVSVDETEEMGRLAADDAVFVLDDWEGFEKGVSNALMLYARGVAPIPVFPQPGTQVGMMLRDIRWARQ